MKISDVTTGTVLFADAGFDCLKPNQPCEVKKDDAGELYVECACGQHGLDGQLDFATQTELVGLSPTPWKLG